MTEQYEYPHPTQNTRHLLITGKIEKFDIRMTCYGDLVLFSNGPKLEIFSMYVRSRLVEPIKMGPILYFLSICGSNLVLTILKPNNSSCFWNVQ
jgi:hypothetical protein